MIAPPPGVRVWLVAGVTDMRKGFDGLAALVQQHLGQDPFSGQLFAFRGRRGDLVKVLSWDGQGRCLYAKRMEKGRFVWPQATNGAVSLTAAQLSMLLEGIDWRMPVRTWRPDMGEAYIPAREKLIAIEGGRSVRVRAIETDDFSWREPAP